MKRGEDEKGCVRAIAGTLGWLLVKRRWGSLLSRIRDDENGAGFCWDPTQDGIRSHAQNFQTIKNKENFNRCNTTVLCDNTADPIYTKTTDK